MRKMTRRSFLKRALLPAALGTSLRDVLHGEEPGKANTTTPDIIDTNVHLFDWPFRKLKYARTKALVAKLRKHRITQAWAGSYEGLLHKNLDGVNARLAEECQANGANLLPLRDRQPGLARLGRGPAPLPGKVPHAGAFGCTPRITITPCKSPEVARLLQAGPPSAA